MVLHRWTPSVLLALFAVGLSACTTLYDAYPDRRYPDPYPDPYPRRGPVVYGPADDYRRTPEYRRIGRDADAYADFLDRELRLSRDQERAVEHVLERRADGLLRSVHPRDHRYVYPFPRSPRLDGTARRWWDDADREIERYLSRSQRGAYRYIAADLERGGRYDGGRQGLPWPYRDYDRDDDDRGDDDDRWDDDRWEDDDDD
jgi:hypothetical protein